MIKFLLFLILFRLFVHFILRLITENIICQTNFLEMFICEFIGLYGTRNRIESKYSFLWNSISDNKPRSYTTKCVKITYKLLPIQSHVVRPEFRYYQLLNKLLKSCITPKIGTYTCTKSGHRRLCIVHPT